MIMSANKIKDENKKIDLYKKIISHFSKVANCEFILQQVKHSLELLKRQILVDDFDDKLQKKGDDLFKKFPRKSILGSTVNETLYYCLIYHPNATIDKKSSPLGIQKEFKVFTFTFFFYFFLFYFLDLDFR